MQVPRVTSLSPADGDKKEEQAGWHGGHTGRDLKVAEQNGSSSLSTQQRHEGKDGAYFGMRSIGTTLTGYKLLS